MNIPFLFLSTVLIWGTTWIAIALQTGDIPVIVSIFYRFALAGAVMILGLAAMGRLARPTQWRFVFVQALCLFCFNFIGIYNATLYISSGLVSVVFSLASVFNAVNARVFFGDRITPRVLIAAAIGVSGLILLFWHDLFTHLDLNTLRGVGFAAAGTMLFSLGNMASRKNSDLGVSPVTANAWGMAIGAAAVFALTMATGHSIRVPLDVTYWSAMVYLSVIGSVAGFTAYLMLVQRVGSAKAGYATVVFPAVALLISTAFEGFEWTWTAAVGLALIFIGNVVMFAKR